jgi:hypothetical protein
LVLLLTVDWATLSSLATAAGTLVLAIATFSAVRSSNRSARIAEAALQEQRRRLLANSRLEDPVQKIMFLEGNWLHASGGHAAVEHVDGSAFLAISLRNVGSGIGVCQGWAVRGLGAARDYPTHAALGDFRLQARDLYVPAGDIGMWQGALRNPDDPMRAAVIEAIETSQTLTVELLYSDQVGLQRTISRFGLVPTGDSWLATVNRHWYLDWDGPRPEGLTRAASEVIVRDQEAAAPRRADPDGERDQVALHDRFDGERRATERADPADAQDHL